MTYPTVPPPHVLVLGGTSGASALARALHGAGVAGVFSYAGVTDAPIAQPLPMRVGGFGGVQGLVQFLREQCITHVVDATHPFAAQMSRHACVACAAAGVPLLALERPAWQPGPGDRWINVADCSQAARALPSEPARVFLAVGRTHLAAFAVRPEHRYLLRLVNPPGQSGLPLPSQSILDVIVARGPFDMAADLRLLQAHGIGWVVSKNAGGEAARSKIDAARALGLPVVMVQRPVLPVRPCVQQVGEVLQWLLHGRLP